MCVCICVCVAAGGRWRECRGQIPQTPGIYFDNNNNPPRLPVRLEPPAQTEPSSGIMGLGTDTQAHTHTHTNTHTHALELQLCTTSQSNTSLLSKQHQNTPTTFHRRAEGFLVITQPPAAMLEALSSRGTVTVKVERGLITGLHIYLVIVVSRSNCLFRM